MIAVVSVALLIAFAIGPAYGLDTTTPSPEPIWGTKDTITLTVAIIGAVTGVLGAVLGGLNTWNAISARRVRLRVSPSFAYSMHDLDAEPLVGIEVINLSGFAVTVKEVGFTLAGTKARGAAINPILLDGGSMPRRLESREAFTAYLQKPDPRKNRIQKVYAWLASGERVTGTGPTMKALRNRL